MNFRNDIQGLRAIAVLFVFIFHLSNTYLPGGFIGVDMFFVISGYLISKIVHFKMSKGKFNLLDFYIGRVKRIVPAYYFMLICCWILFMIVFVNSEVGKFKLGHFHTFLFNSNNYFSKIDDYFGASSNENPFLHTWTLAVEMQFYLILPLLLLLLRNVKTLLIILSLLTISLLGYSTYEIFSGNKALMYFSLLSRSPEFFIGVILALSKIEEKNVIKRNASLLSIIGIVILFISAMLFTERSPFPGISSLVPCLGIGVILISPSAKLNLLISNPKIIYLGEISYSLYLWHWPIMAFYRYNNERYEFTALETVIVIALTIIASLFSYYLIERPLRSKEGSKFSLPFGMMAVLNILMIYFVVPAKNKISNIPDEYTFPSFGKFSHGKDFKEVGILGDTAYRGKRILFLGDSHALTFKPYMDKMGKEHNLSFRTITNDAYPAIPFIDYKDIIEPNRLEVYKKLEPHIDREIKEADVIVVYFAQDGKRWKNAIERLLESLRTSQRIIFISDYPGIDKNPVRTNRGIVKDSSRKQNYQLRITKIDKGVLNMIESFSNAKYIDLDEYQDFF